MVQTRTILSLQSDLTQPSTPVASEDVANKDYVDTAVAGVVVNDAGAGSDPAGGVKGIATFNQDKGLDIGLAGVAEAKVATTEGVDFDGSGQIRAKIDATQGSEYSAGGAVIPRIDGVTVFLDGSGRLSSSGGGGALAGQVSVAPEVTQDITAVTAPTPGTLGTDTDTLNFPDGSTTGQRFKWQIPVDYNGGDVTILTSYAMGAAIASPNNVVRLETQAEVIGAGGIALQPLSAFDLTVPDGTTDIQRDTILVVSSAAVTAGDTLEIFVKRIGGHGNDAATTSWRVADFEISYLSSISNRGVTDRIEVLRDTDEPATTPVTVGTETDAEEFPTGSDTEQKVSFIVPGNWDGATPPSIICQYTMSSAAAGTVRLATEAEVVRASVGSLDTLPIVNFDLVPPVDTDPHLTTAIRQLEPSTIDPGDFVTLKLARRTSVGGNHAGGFRLISIQVVWAIKVQTVNADERYMELSTFEIISATGVWGDTGVPSFAGDFEVYDEMASLVAAGRLNAIYFSRLRTDQTKIANILIPIKGTGGTPQYKINVHVDGGGVTNVYSGSVLTSAPGVVSEISIPELDLTAQPVGKKRFHIVVEAHVNAGDTLFVGRPFVSQE